MVNFNGDVVFVDTSGQIRSSTGDITIRADNTGLRSIIVGSGSALRPDRTLGMNLGTSYAEWNRLYTGDIKAVSGFWGIDQNTSYIEISRDTTFDVQIATFSGTSVSFLGTHGILIGGRDEGSLFDCDAATTIFRNLVQYDARPFVFVNDTVFYSDVATIDDINQVRPVDQRDVSGLITVDTDNSYRLGSHIRRFSSIFAGSGIFNALAPSISGTYINVLGSVMPGRDALWSLGRDSSRWATLYAVSGFIETISPITSGGFTTLNGSFIPDQDQARNLGFNNKRWAVLQVGSGVFSNAITLKGIDVVTRLDAITTLHGVVTANSGAMINVNTERDIYNYTIPANTLQPSGKLRLELIGSVTNMSASNVNFTPQVYINGTSIWGDVFAVPQGPRPRDFEFNIDICSLGSLTGQRVRGYIGLGSATAGSVTGNGDFGATFIAAGNFSSVATSGTVSFASPVTIRVSMQMGTASTLASYSGFHGILTHYPWPRV